MKKIGKDFWGRETYKHKGNIFKDVEGTLHSVTAEREPLSPVRKQQLKNKIGTKFGIMNQQGIIQKEMVMDLNKIGKVSSDPLAYAWGQFQAKSGQPMAKAEKGDKLAPEYIRGFQTGSGFVKAPAGVRYSRKKKLKNLLKTEFSPQKSFYGKAKVKTEGGGLVLQSYETDVAKIVGGKAIVKGLYSHTTTRHIKDFLKQHGIKVKNSKQIMKDYGGSW